MARENFSKVIRLTEKQKQAILEEIRAFYIDERGEEIGIIEEIQLFDLFMENMAPVIYNKALDDARGWFKSQMENVENDFYMLYREEK